MTGEADIGAAQGGGIAGEQPRDENAGYHRRAAAHP